MQVFEGYNVEIILDESGEPLFEIYSTGMALGYVNSNVDGKIYPHKKRIEQTIKNAEITPVYIASSAYFDENRLYDFMFEAKTAKCKSFRKWVTSEVLPSIRKTGGYVLEGTEAEMQARAQEAIEWQRSRQTGIAVRKKETSIIQSQLIPLAESQGSKNAQRLYTTYSRLILTTLDIKAKERHRLHRDYLDLIRQMEKLIEREISIEVDKLTHYKDIYQICKTKCRMLKELTILPEGKYI